MKSVPPEPSDLVNCLRQQLILAQVRIMELEDTRDSLLPRIEELTSQLNEALILADNKSDEAAHLGKVLAEAQSRGTQLHQLLEQASRDAVAAHALRAETESHLAQANEVIARLKTELGQAAAEIRAMKSSRSWRWTGWLRRLGPPTSFPRA